MPKTFFLSQGITGGAHFKSQRSDHPVSQQTDQTQKKLRSVQGLRCPDLQPRQVPRYSILHSAFRKSRPFTIKIEYLQSTREFIRSHEKKVREYA